MLPHPQTKIYIDTTPRMRFITKFHIILLIVCFVSSNANLSWSGLCMDQEGVHSLAEACSTPSCHELVLPEAPPRPASCGQMSSSGNSEKECVDLLRSDEFHVYRPYPATLIQAGPLPLLFYSAPAHYAFSQKSAPLRAEYRELPDLQLRMQRTVVLLI